MPRSCSVCQSPEREAVDLRLVGHPDSASYRAIARQFGMSKDAVRRHADEHLPATLAKAHEAGEAACADDLLGQVRDLQARTLAILEAAEETGELRTALAAIREARGNLELIGRVTKELEAGPTLNLYLSAEWLELRAVIVGALEPHSDARESVLRALEGTGNGR